MGAAVDLTARDKLSVAIIAAKQGVKKTEEHTHTTTRSSHAPPPNSSSSTRESSSVSRSLRAHKPNKLVQSQLSLTIVSKGRFDKSEPTIHHGEDLDVPTFLRRGVGMN